MEKPYLRKENYCKYNAVSARLLEDLHAGKTAKESARALGISLPTYYKYKGLVSAENGQVYILPEERKFLQEKALLTGNAEQTGCLQESAFVSVEAAQSEQPNEIQPSEEKIIVTVEAKPEDIQVADQATPTAKKKRR